MEMTGWCVLVPEVVPRIVNLAADLDVRLSMRAREGLPSLRSDRLLFEAMRRSIAASEKDDFRVVHFSVQSNHLHLIVEADDEHALSRGMQALSIRMVHAAHRALGHGGSVFSDRYHAHYLKTPRETRAALLYVLQNWAKHGLGGDYDPRSSAIWFDGWSKAPGSRRGAGCRQAANLARQDRLEASRASAPRRTTRRWATRAKPAA